ncbi:PIN domain-containing protein [Rhizobium sullae]|uniref:PIN domain-containing protein n=1 Tax=Rhizobium sullae TaxID=50338 RepID=A0ABY5XE30_RHISU|nr:PIN domain-containing protein [Rhizobium sullae]UWU12797.1 PIN domain-containing protein [Rhizobium sullae]
MSSKPTRQEVRPLKTRHVFLDTEVYRRAGYNVRNSQFKVFGDYILAGKLVLHTTDITYAEVSRQIMELVSERAARLKKIAHDFQRMSQLSNAFPKLSEVDEKELGQSLWKAFLDVIINDFNANHILAQQIPVRRIFEKYFAGAAPFAKRGSKEFPDAFMVEALADFCAENSARMYVISGDAQLRSAAGSHPALIPLGSIDDLLASCAAESDIDLEPLVDQLFEHPGFDDQLFEVLSNEAPYLEGLYFGDLTDGSVKDIWLDEILAVDGYTLAAVDDIFVSLILDVPCVLQASVDYIYEDPDVEEGDAQYVTTATDSISGNVHLKVYLRIDTSTARFVEKELLTKRAIFQ